MVVGAAAVLVLLVGGGVDYARTLDRVPDPPPPCRPAATACHTRAAEIYDQRLERANELEADLETRAWVYGAVALAAVLAATGVAFRRTPVEARREPFTDIGVGAVVWLLGTVVISLATSGELVVAPTAPMFVLGGVALAIAAVGTLATARTRVDGPPPATISASAASSAPSAVSSTAGRYAPWMGVALTVVAIVAAVIIAQGYGDPCFESEPSWLDALMTVTGAAAGGAALCGLASLLARRWIVALLLLAAGPFAFLVAAFGSVCWN